MDERSTTERDGYRSNEEWENRNTQEGRDPYEVGAIWATSWGYEQTNVEFFQVIRESAKSVWVREIAQEARDGRVWPVPDAFLEDDGRAWRENERKPGGKVCRKDSPGGYQSIRIDDIRYAFPYEGGGRYETFAAGGMGH